MTRIGSGAKGLCKELQPVGNQFLTPLICGVPNYGWAEPPRWLLKIGGKKKRKWKKT